MAEIPSKMKALIKEEAVASYLLKDLDVPEPQGDEVLFKVDAVSICGSDIALYHYNDVAKAIASLPFIPGHEAAGTVVKCGPQVPLPALPLKSFIPGLEAAGTVVKCDPQATVAVGDRIAVENHFFCDACYQCRHDRREICQHMGQYGHGRKTIHGGCSQYSIVSSKYCYVLTTDISAAEAALLEPLGVSHNAIEQLGVENEDVLIIGCGPIGSLACSLAKAMGAARVIAADIDANRLDLAKQMGADVLIDTSKQDLTEVVLRETKGDGIGRLAEMSGASPVVNTMWTCLRKGGHVVMVGLPKAPIHIENPLPNFVFKCLTLKTIHGRRVFQTWPLIENLVAKKQVDVTKVISHQLPMEQYEEAFQALFGGKACKIVLYPNGKQ